MVETVSERAEAGAVGAYPAIESPPSPRDRLRQLTLAIGPYRVAIGVYLATRVLLIVVALLNQELRHHSIASQLANWDGVWYRRVAEHGYPTHALHTRTTLGFFPLFPIAMWLVAHAFATTPDVAGVLISLIGGLVATVLVQKLAAGWWGERSGRRAAILFSLFAGSVVFSMDYSEGLLLPLAAGCILALERRRWLAAGVMAGFGTAVGPDSLVLIPVCAVAAGMELRARTGTRDLRSLVAPALSLVGAAAFAIFLWAWTGTPFASVIAQHYGWGERTDPFALVNQLKSLLPQISFSHFNHPTINLNLVVGLAGAVVLAAGLDLLWRTRPRPSIPAIVWTLGIAFLAVTSEYVPPNPRLLITAFPVILVFAHAVRGRLAYGVLLAANGVLLAGLSALTFVGITLRP